MHVGNCFISPFLILLDYGAGHGSIEDEDSTSQLPFDPHTFFYGNSLSSNSTSILLGLKFRILSLPAPFNPL